MWSWELPLLVAVSATCKFEVGGYVWDFCAFEGNQTNYLAPDQTEYVFTFCAAKLCPDISSSMCQFSPDGMDRNSLGVWAANSNWTWISTDSVSLQMGDGNARWCDAPRTTLVTFQCADVSSPVFVMMEETASCVYAAQVQVPRSVCPGYNPSCCTPVTYASTRVEAGGLTAVMQVDERGMWFDQDYQGKGQSVLCSKTYGKCFTFTETSCVSSQYRPAPSQCFDGPNWTLIKFGPLADSLPLRQSAWLSRADGSYVVTMPLGDSKSCVVVSGNKIDTSFEFTVTPNVTLWDIPQSCIKAK